MTYANVEATGVVVLDTTLPVLATLSTTTAGQIVQGVRVNGLVQVNHPGVTFSNCILEQGLQANNQGPVLDHCIVGNPAWLAQGHAPGVVFPEAGCPGTKRDYGVGYGGYTARWCRIFGFGDAFKANGNVLIEDSVIYSLYAYKTGTSSWNHCDGIQVTQGSNVTIRRCQINPMGYTPGGGVLSTSAVMVKADQGNIDSVLIEDCLLSGGNSFTVYAVDGLAGVTTNVTIRGNRFRRKLTGRVADEPWPKGSQNGVLAFGTNVEASLVWDSNVWDDTGDLIPWGLTGHFSRV